MEDIVLSIIIPIYNVEQYLAQCLDSIYLQDLEESKYEVICVNDVSPDNSRGIVLKYQSIHDNLIFIEHETNSRQGGARNTGLNVAKGKYIWFIDSDDYIEQNMFSKLITILEDNQLDILHFDYKRLYFDGRVENYRIQYVDETIYTGLDFLENMNFEPWWKRCAEVWRKIYRKDFLLNNALFFVPNVMYEDTDWSIKSIILAHRVMHVNNAPYIYRENRNSVTQQKVSPQIVSYKLKLLCRCKKLLKMLNNTKFYTQIESYIQYLGQDIIREYKCLNRNHKICFYKNISCVDYILFCKSVKLSGIIKMMYK